jgi:hypothetical protein
LRQLYKGQLVEEAIRAVKEEKFELASKLRDHFIHEFREELPDLEMFERYIQWCQKGGMFGGTDRG